MLEKKDLRKRILALRRSINKEELRLASDKITESILAWDCYRRAEKIMLYLAMPDEPDLDGVIEDALTQGKTVCVPHLTAAYGVMEAAIITGLADLARGKLNIRSPNPATLKTLDAGLLDLIVVPGVAYDLAGRRLGMAGGYYDRFLPRAARAIKIGAVWRQAIVDEVPFEPHDQLVDYLVSQTGIFKCA